MAEISRQTLLDKLGRLAHQSLEGAAHFCNLRGHRYVQVVHWVHQILSVQDSDLHRIVRHFDLNSSRLAADLTDVLDAVPRGGAAVMNLDPTLDDAMERAWLFASLEFGAAKIRTGHLVVGLLSAKRLRADLLGLSDEFEKVDVDALAKGFTAVLEGSPEEADAAAPAPAAAAAGDTGRVAPAALGKREALGRYAVDLTARARAGELDPAVGRDEEIRQIVDVLMRRRQNNPILVGEAGVGKTAVVEGFAQRVAAGDVPPPLKDVSIFALDLGLLQAGAGVKGEFENRVRQVIEEVQSSPTPIVLFVDEAHTLIGAGGAEGQGDAANLLKPALARGTLRTIAATTWAEYKKYFEKDAALTRRFQPIKVDEPAEARAVRMLRGAAAKFEQHHRVRVLDEAIAAAVKLSQRYIPARQLPDKAVSLLDTACARVATAHGAKPAPLEDCRRQIEALDVELGILDREARLGRGDADRRADVQKQRDDEAARRERLEARWTAERDVVQQILALEARLAPHVLHPPAGGAGGADGPAAAGRNGPSGNGGNGGNGGTGGTGGTDNNSGGAASAAAPATGAAAPDEAAARDELARLRARLAELQGEDPLVVPGVDEQVVAAVVSDWTGIPVGRMVKDEIEAILNLADRLEKRVIGQRHALEAIASRVQTSRAGVDNPNRPVGVFLLAGPSGVGKTETALALAEALYGGEQNLITINMSEFQEPHTVSNLKGSPKGYIGYGEGGVLTEAVRRRPYSVVLLDEIEKAHKDVHELFFQVFDKGFMDDAEGRRIDFKNTILLLTSNVGSDEITALAARAQAMADGIEGGGAAADGAGATAAGGDEGGAAAAGASAGAPPARPGAAAAADAIRPALREVFPAALLGRLVAVPYYPISDDMLRSIVRLQIRRIEARMADRGIAFTYDPAVVEVVASRSSETESGARAVDAILTHTVLPTVSRHILGRLARGAAVAGVHVGAADGDFVYNFRDKPPAGQPTGAPTGAPTGNPATAEPERAAAAAGGPTNQ